MINWFFQLNVDNHFTMNQNNNYKFVYNQSKHSTSAQITFVKEKQLFLNVHLMSKLFKKQISQLPNPKIFINRNQFM